MSVTWEGARFDARTASMLQEVRFRLEPIRFQPSQGSYSTGVGASAGTHGGGGAVDIRLSGLSDADARLIETVMRSVGFAAWRRLDLPGVWPRHIHGIAVGCSDLSREAAQQVSDYRAGLDGLARRGRDTGSRAYVGVTWETYDPPAESVARAVWGKVLAG